MNGNSEGFLLNRRARVLRVVALVSSILGGITTAISISNLLGLTFSSQGLPTKLGYLSACASCLIVSVVCYWLGRKRQARQIRVGAYLIIGLWAVIVTGLTTFSPVVASSFVLPILGAGMLLAAREIVGWTLAVLVMCASSFILNIALNLTPSANSQTAVNSAGYYSMVSYLILLSVTGGGLWYLQVNTRTILAEISRRLLEISQLSDDREQKRQLGLQVGQTMRQQATELSGVSVQQEDEARKQVEAVGAMILVMEQLNQSARQVAQTSNEGVAVAERTRQSASNVRQTAAQASQTTQEGLNTTEATITAINEVQTQINSLETRLEELVNRSGQISRIVEVMRTLADQTHLLALNAAIESAGAGEYGRRFAVVADEVKQLADRSLLATREVQQIVGQTQEAIQEASQVSLAARQQSAGAVERARRCGKLIGELGEVIQLNFNRADDILNETRRVNDIMGEIAVINDQQRQTAEEITEVLRDVGQVARENAGVTKQLNQAAGQLEMLSSELTVALAGSVEQMVLAR